jgi:hypothetical protein
MVDANLVVNNLSLASGGVISAPSGLSTLTANGTSSIAGTITTSGNQRYAGAVTLTANTALVSGTGNISFGSTINGTTADVESLSLNAGASGVITFGGNIGGSVRLSDLVITNAGSLALGANTTINILNAFTLNKPLAGAGYSLGVTNNAVISAALSGLSSISIGGTTSLGASVTTTGTQTYTGAVVLAATSTLTTTNADISFGSTVDSNGSTPYGLILENGSGTSTFGGTVGATNALASLTTATGSTSLAGDVNTAGAQTYGGNVLLNSSVALNSSSNGDIEWHYLHTKWIL